MTSFWRRLVFAARFSLLTLISMLAACGRVIGDDFDDLEPARCGETFGPADCAGNGGFAAAGGRLQGGASAGVDHESKGGSAAAVSAGGSSAGLPGKAGTAGEGGTSGAEQQGSTAGSSGADDANAPQVVSITPSDGTTSVTEPPVVITFNRPMNKASVEALFPDATNFNWDESGLVVRMTLPFGHTDTPKTYTVRVATSAQDLAGNFLMKEATATFTLAALKKTTVFYYQSRTGNQLEGSTSAYTFFMAGDNSNGKLLYGALSFSLASLPTYSEVVGVRSATVKVQIIKLQGNPRDPALGPFQVDHVAFPARLAGTATMLQPAVYVIEPAAIVPGAQITFPVTSILAKTWENLQDMLQFRVCTPHTNHNAQPDSIVLRRGASENKDIVDPSVTNPDPANAARLEIEYFDDN